MRRATAGTALVGFTGVRKFNTEAHVPFDIVGGRTGFTMK